MTEKFRWHLQDVAGIMHPHFVSIRKLEISFLDTHLDLERQSSVWIWNDICFIIQGLLCSQLWDKIAKDWKHKKKQLETIRNAFGSKVLSQRCSPTLRAPIICAKFFFNFILHPFEGLQDARFHFTLITDNIYWPVKRQTVVNPITDWKWATAFE